MTTILTIAVTRLRRRSVIARRDYPWGEGHKTFGSLSLSLVLFLFLSLSLAFSPLCVCHSRSKDLLLPLVLINPLWSIGGGFAAFTGSLFSIHSLYSAIRLSRKCFSAFSATASVGKERGLDLLASITTHPFLYLHHLSKLQFYCLWFANWLRALLLSLWDSQTPLVV